MTWHTVAWSEATASGTLQPIAAVPDDQVFTSGDDVRIPTGLSALLGAFSLGLAPTRARIVAPSLRAFANFEIAPKIVSETTPDLAPNRLMTMVRDPLPLAVGEFVNFESDAGDATNSDVCGVAMLGEGPIQPVTGQFRTLRATASITGTQRAWASEGVAFSEDLPAGRYQVIGARCEADQPGAFRLIFREGGPRPGALSVPTDAGGDIPGQRMGGWGVWGEFDINQPPTLEVLSLGAAGAAQVLYLDLIRIGG